MKKFASLALFLALLVPLNGAENCAIGIRSLVSPDYPNLARAAQISGEVHLLARVGEDGRVKGADASSGPPILEEDAQKNLLTWRFTKRPEQGKIEVVYHYRLRGPKIYGTVVPTVSLESPTVVVITSNPPLPTGGSPE